MSEHGVPVPEAAPNHDIAAGEMLDPADVSEIGLLGRPAELQFTRLAAAYRKQKDKLRDHQVHRANLDAVLADQIKAIDGRLAAIAEGLLGKARACKELVDQLLVLAKRVHYEVDEDPFYSCAKAERYCGTDPVGVCNCGADAHNEKVDELADKIRELLG